MDRSSLNLQTSLSALRTRKVRKEVSKFKRSFASLDFFGDAENNKMAWKYATVRTMAERRKLETILTEHKLVSDEQLKQIVRYAQAVGIDLHEAVLQKKVAPPDAVMMAYAESVGIPFIHLADVSIDEEVVAQIDPMTARQYSVMPVSLDHGHVLLVTTKPIIPDIADELRMVFNLPVRCAICTPAELSDAIAKYYPRDTARMVSAERNKVLQPQPAAKKPQQPVVPMNNEEIRDRFMKTFAAFNFTFAFTFLAPYYLPLPRWIGDHSFLFFLLGILFGGIAARATWKVLSR
jgi:hypothetical protein